jgi:hypothetical protein
MLKSKKELIWAMEWVSELSFMDLKGLFLIGLS